MAKEFEDPFEPAHQLAEEPVVVNVDFVYEFVEIVLMSRAKVDEGLYRLIRVGRDVLTLCELQDSEHVVCEGCEICDGIIDICRFVDANERFVEDGEEVAEELKGDGFFNDGEHHGFVALACIHFEELLEVGEELCARFHLIVDLEVTTLLAGLLL